MLDDDDIKVTVEEEPEETVAVPEDEKEGKPVDKPESKEDDDEEYQVDDLSKESEEKRARRREEKKQRKIEMREKRERREAKLKALEQQNLEMQRKLQALEGGQVGFRLEGLRKEKENLQAQFQQTEQRLAEAKATGNLAVATDALELKYRLSNEYKALEQQEQQISQATNQPRPLDRSVVENFNQWHSKNPWFRSDLSNEDSVIADAISGRLVREGFNTSQPEYWEELDRRCAARMPNKNKKVQNYDEYDDEDEPPPQTVSGRGSGARQESGRQEVRIDAETVRLWKEAGIWEDPKERAKAVKQYQQIMDKEKNRG